MIILDTNALIYSVRQRIDLKRFLDEEIAVPSSAIKELEKLSKTNVDAGLALKLAERFRILDVDSTGDMGIIEAATKYGGNVVTNDRNLTSDLKRKNIRVTSVTRGMVRRL